MNVQDKAKHGGNVYEAVRNRGGNFADFLDYSANINPMGLSPQVRAALVKGLDSVMAYPDPDAVALKQTISDTYRVPVEWIETGNGAVEIIYLLCRLLSPHRVMLPSPTFSEYAAAAQAADTACTTIPLDKDCGFIPSIPALSQRLQANDLLFFCNPNNPTGAVLTRRQLEPLIEKAAAVGAHIVFDESFTDFRLTSEAESCRTLIARYPSVIVLHSLTKFLAVPGLRLGFLLARPETVKRMKRLRDPWNVNVLAQIAGVAGLADTEYRRETVTLIDQEKEKMRLGLQAIPGMRVFPPAVNFVLADLGESGWDAEKLQEALMEHRILIRNCANFDGLSNQYMRVAVKGADANQRFIRILNKIFNGAGGK
ncbi:MAG: threonine-phosphate decarboxylase CobD [Negativicutes bacterium]